ncbi:MAG: patatin-like phospholipase family protein [Burkholderiaceae bacterium]|nr:patatin-like phospholipase family protein [Burkholderiaceae bacterium]
MRVFFTLPLLVLILAACQSVPTSSPARQSSTVSQSAPASQASPTVDASGQDDPATPPTAEEPTTSAVPPVAVTPAPAPAAPLPMPRKIKVGLALGGGAARGFAHIGVIKALEANGITPDLVVGTSAGSLVGALYAAGNNGYALQKMAIDMDEGAISDWSVPFFSGPTGVLKGEGLQNYVNRAVQGQPIEKLKMPFGAVATDLRSGRPILFRRGNTGAAVRASSSVPGVFKPVRIGTIDYVDGGLVSPVPASFARKMGADFVIAVNISAQPEVQPASGAFEILLQTFAIMGQSLNQYELQQADIVIRPELASMKGSDFQSRGKAITAGERAAIAAIPELRKRLQLKQQAQ